MSDSSSLNGGFSEDENGHQLTNGFHEENGFKTQSHKRKNGMVNGYGHDHHGPKSPRRVSVTPAALHDEKVYNFCRSLIRRMGRGKMKRCKFVFLIPCLTLDWVDDLDQEFTFIFRQRDEVRRGAAKVEGGWRPNPTHHDSQVAAWCSQFLPPIDVSNPRTVPRRHRINLVLSFRTI